MSGLGLAVVAGTVLILGIPLAGETIRVWISDVGAAIAAAVGVVGCLRAAAHRSGSSRRGWQFMAGALTSWTLAETIWMVNELILEIDPYPSIADAFYLAAVPLAALGLSLIPGTIARTGRIRVVLDGLIGAGALLFVAWEILIRRLLDEGGSILSQSIAIAYPASDALLMTLALFAVTHVRREERTPVATISAAIALIGVADWAFMYRELGGLYTTGTIIDAGWIAGYALIGFGGLMIRSSLPAHMAADPSTPMRIFAPYFPVVPALCVAGYLGVVGEGFSPALAVIGVGVFILAVLRQLVEIFDHRGLARTLEKRVQERTAEIAQSEERFRSLVQNSSDAIVVVDTTGTITYVSDSAGRIFGMPGLAVGSPLADSTHPTDGMRLRGALEAVRETGATATVECRMMGRGDRWLVTESIISSHLKDPSIGGLVLNLRDVTDRKVLEEQLEHQAFHDSLTDLANRALFRDRLEQAIHRFGRSEKPFALLLLDLDRFKDVNDTFGHAAGDQALVLLANRLRFATRSTDTVARLGGDEFAILLEDVHEAEAMEAAARVVESLSDRVNLGGQTVRLGASIGVVWHAAGDVTPGDLLRSADVALYVAKANGRGRVELFRPEMQDMVSDRVRTEVELREAFDRDELVVWWQPVVDMRNGGIVSLEALARWQHPVRGMIPPAEFIPLAEERGLIAQLDLIVLRKVCVQLARWNRDGRGPEHVNINLSAAEISDENVVEKFQAVLEETGVDPTSLVIEITESTLLQDADEAIQTLGRFKALGVQIAVDDFGTGYSSLKYLRRFPVDILKIDQSFVRDIGQGPEDAAVPRAVLALGRSFNLQVVAEGVERPEQRDALVEFGCFYGQGYLFARPAPASEIEALLPARVASA